MTTPTAQTDEAGRALKARHRAMWALGDYPALADEIIPDLGGVLAGGSLVVIRPARSLTGMVSSMGR